MLTLFLTLFTFILPITFAHANLGPSQLLLQQVNTSQKDVALAREVHQFLRDLRNNSVKPQVLAKLIRDSQNSFPFQELTPSFALVEKIQRSLNNPKIFFTHCKQQVEEHKPISPLHQRMHDDIHTYCRLGFLNLVRNKKLPSQLDRVALDYLSTHLSHYLRGEHQAIFLSILPDLTKNNVQKKFISNEVESIYIRETLAPNPSVLQHLNVSDKLTNYIQAQGDFDTQVNRYFRDQLREMISELRKKVENDQFDEIDKELQQTYSFYFQNRIYINQNYMWTNLQALGRRLTYKKRFDSAKIAFHSALEMSDPSQIDEARFGLLWNDVLKKDYRSALRTIQQHGLLDSLSQHSSKLKFWMAQVLIKNGQKPQGQSIFNEIISNDPMSFYAIMSMREQGIKTSTPSPQLLTQTNRIPSSGDFIANQINFKESYRRSLSRLSLWLTLDLDQYSFFEIDYLYSSYVSNGLENGLNLTLDDFNGLLTQKFADFFNSQDKYLHTFRLLNSHIQTNPVALNTQSLGHLFPHKYLEEVAKIDQSIDPLIILALIRQESAFNPTARSGAGARGLMQIMPATGRSLQRNLRVNQLNHPQTNLRLGIRYFKRLANQFDGDLVLTLASYNAGQGNVRNWQQNIFHLDDDPLVRIEMIPFKETRKYVKLIYRNIYFYNLIKERSLLSEPFDKTLQLSFYEPKH